MCPFEVYVVDMLPIPRIHFVESLCLRCFFLVFEEEEEEKKKNCIANDFE